MRAFVWAPGVMQQPGLRRLYWNEDGRHTTTNPLRSGAGAGSHPSAWQLILPHGTFEGGSVSFPRTRGMWEGSRFRLRVIIRTSPPGSDGQCVLLFGFKDLNTIEMRSPLGPPGWTQQVITMRLPPWPPGIEALREQYRASTGRSEGRSRVRCALPTAATLCILAAGLPLLQGEHLAGACYDALRYGAGRDTSPRALAVNDADDASLGQQGAASLVQREAAAAAGAAALAAALHVQRAYKTIRANTSQPHCAAANAAMAAARAARASTWTQEALGYVADALQHARLWAADDGDRGARRRMAAEALCALSGQGQGRRDGTNHRPQP